MTFSQRSQGPFRNGRPVRALLGSFLKFTLCLVGILPLLNPEAPVRAETTAPRGFLWEVRSAKTTIYLAGSIHLQKEDVPLPADYLKVFRCCPKLFFETDIRQIETAESAQRLARAGTLPPGDSLDRHLRPATRTALHRFVDERGIPGEFIQKLRPWLCALTLAVREMQLLGYDPRQGVDQRLFRLGLEKGKMMGGLETPDEQVGLFEGLTPEQEEDFLRQTLKDLQSIEETSASMFDTWRTGDATTLAALIEKSFAGFPDIYARFLIDRNRRWAEKIAALMSEPGPVMIVVGAAHLVGRGNLAERLESRGFRLKRLAHTGE